MAFMLVRLQCKYGKTQQFQEVMSHLVPVLEGKGWRLHGAYQMTGEGLYVIDISGVPTIRRVQAMLRDTVSLIRDNPLYGATPAIRSDDVPREWFLERVIGKVAAEIKVREPDLFAA